MKLDKDSYPVQYINPVLLEDGTLVQLRPVHPLDGEQAQEFRARLSKESLYNRFLGYVPKISEKLIDRLTRIDYTREMAIVAEVQGQEEKEIIAVARIASDQKTGVAEFAIIIADNWQGKGLGSIMTDYMIKVAEKMRFEKLYALVFSDNINMLEILRQQGFVLSREDAVTTHAELTLGV